ncbi:MAG: hypothetical protein AB7F35_29105 [Acetobacteraceae bacterium]
MLSPVDVAAPYLDRIAKPAGFVLGLDFGMTRDYSALIVNEKRPYWTDDVYHAIRFAHRFKRRTKYQDVAREVADVMARLPPRPEPPALYADSTGVGKPVCDLLRGEGLHPYDVTITAGAHCSYNGYAISLPKSILVSTLNVALQNGMIGIAGNLPWQEQLVRELGAFRMTVTAAGHDVFNSRTEADHDDLVIALGLAVWGAARVFRTFRTVFL